VRSALTIVAALALTTPAFAAVYTVPGTNATLQDAINAALVNVDPDNTIYLTASPHTIGATLVFTDIQGHTFASNHRLTIRPAAALGRAAIESVNAASPAIELGPGGYVTFQDLDIVRNVTNAADLVTIDKFVWGVFDRCRLGSIWTGGGDPGKKIMQIHYPNPILVRDCIFFSVFPGTFDYGIIADSFNDITNALYLYNDDVADYKLRGVWISGGVPGSLALLRNNVVANNPALATEPIAYIADANADITVITSDNVSYASAANIETNLAVQSVAGFGGGSLLTLSQADIPASFTQTAWNLVPPWDPNTGFYHLNATGPLELPSAYGQSVGNGFPAPQDLAVNFDIDREYRPGGTPLHTDRGADQLEGGTSGVAPGPAGGERLSAAPLRNPGPDAVVLARSGEAGRLVFEIFDLAGRRLYHDEHPAASGDRITFAWRGALRSGIVRYRVRLVGDSGVTSAAGGTIAIVR
jgi:hypothetical protein